MGKRKNKDEEEHIKRKMKKLERKMAKIRRKRLSSSSGSSIQEQDLVTVETADNASRSEFEQIQGKLSNSMPNHFCQSGIF